jgi:aspartate kinase
MALLPFQAGSRTAARIAVLKFGGTCVASEVARLQVIARIHAARVSGWQVVVVVSAMGRRGAPYATDTLLEMVGRECPAARPEDLAAAYACGELLSASLVSGLLRSAGVPAACLAGWQAGIVTTESANDALVTDVRPQRLLDLLAEGTVPVVAGSQGVSDGGTITTLGRGGSDTTATVLGVALDAGEIVIYTDTPGIMTADPALVPAARILSSVSHRACERYASLGAKVIQAKAVRAAALRPEIQLVVRGLGDTGSGTRVGQTGWLPAEYGRPLGVGMLQCEGAAAGVAGCAPGPGDGNAPAIRVSVVHEGEGARGSSGGYAAALAAARIVPLQDLCEDDCFSVWVPLAQARAAAGALHAAALG